MYWLFWQISQWLGVMVFLIIAYGMFMYFRKMKRLENYTAQGVYMLPGFDTIPLGNMDMF